MTDETEKAMADVAPFKIYRAASAKDFNELTHMEYAGITPVIEAALVKAGEASSKDSGQVVKELFSMPGMSLTYAWFKSGFPLPLHTHNADCLYYIIAGTLKLGVEELGAGDGFFVGSNVPYTYKPGPNGVEVLEFRTADKFDIRFLGKTETYWNKTIGAIAEKQDAWVGERPPHELAGPMVPAE
ncbi:cupin domain-containing protein [Novosphingobium sp.]|uniref:cupin domain-containing protein n=1 Tax=Novosphingobium sp. TaxID=1874826 RepID=UPI0038BA6096